MTSATEKNQKPTYTPLWDKRDLWRAVTLGTVTLACLVGALIAFIAGGMVGAGSFNSGEPIDHGLAARWMAFAGLLLGMPALAAGLLWGQSRLMTWGIVGCAALAALGALRGYTWT
ncbi:hypothetical protein [Motilibacter deserti]|uniref:TrbC/VIRB2 family protein n=1 Tax=Motilibacter deserti TaxID=2714956 RepID=A0ABX0H3L9_9ACTN|nr:hypothetical protein [Motilibacter deserti]NHC16370.1 hypothetical protein [Motilibacter deserti]